MNKKVNASVFQLRKVIRDIKTYNKDWRYAEAFEKYVSTLNRCSTELNLPNFSFENFHYSATGKTINDTGYESLIGHIEILESMLPSIFENASSTNKGSDGNFKQATTDSNKVFIVHGRDKGALIEAENLVRRLGLEPIVLNRMASSGLSLIEKFEKYADVQYAIVLLTPDDIGALYENAPLQQLELKFRARQNVIFELGFFYGKLGRSKVCCLYKDNIELPTDITGIVYLPFNQSVEDVELDLIREFKEANMNVYL